jgi:hypothetical protein
MTRKHFASVAALFKAELDAAVAARHLSEADAVARIARRLAVELARTNGSFRFDTFYAACGLTADGFRPLDLGTGMVP